MVLQLKANFVCHGFKFLSRKACRQNPHCGAAAEEDSAGKVRNSIILYYITLYYIILYFMFFSKFNYIILY